MCLLLLHQTSPYQAATDQPLEKDVVEIAVEILVVVVEVEIDVQLLLRLPFVVLVVVPNTVVVGDVHVVLPMMIRLFLGVAPRKRMNFQIAAG